MAALYVQDFQASTEIIVIDNGSQEFNLEKWKYNHPNVRWILNETKKNPYTSRNIGVATSKGRYLAFLDAKCEPHLSWLSNMMNGLEGEYVIVAGCYRLYYNTESLKDKVYGMLYLNNEKNVRKGFGVTAGNLLVEKKVYKEIGHFHDENVSGNDIEWSLRAIESGYKIRYASMAIINYPAQTWEELNVSILKYASGVARINNEKRPNFSTFLPLRLSTFLDHIRHRSFENLSIWDKLRLWGLTWVMKVKYAMALLRSRSKS